LLNIITGGGPVLTGDYADLLIYLALRDHNIDRFREAYAMWDGVGVRDQATTTDGRYASYKLALLLIGARALGYDMPDSEAIKEKLWSMQQPHGGITTLYDRLGEPTGSAGTETTALALLSTLGDIR
jgi:hypothetical protein